MLLQLSMFTLKDVLKKVLTKLGTFSGKLEHRHLILLLLTSVGLRLVTYVGRRGDPAGVGCYGFILSAMKS